MGRRGFTLIEVLIVMVVISLLAAGLVVMIQGFVEREKQRKTAAIIKALVAGCEQYYSRFKVYPPDRPYKGSQNLHYYLATGFETIVDYDTMATKTEPPILREFKSYWLQGNPSSVDPADGGPKPIVDSWDQVIEYQRPDPKRKYVIRSYGPNGIPGDEDDIDNSNVDSYLE